MAEVNDDENTHDRTPSRSPITDAMRSNPDVSVTVTAPAEVRAGREPTLTVRIITRSGTSSWVRYVDWGDGTQSDRPLGLVSCPSMDDGKAMPGSDLNRTIPHSWQSSGTYQVSVEGIAGCTSLEPDARSGAATITVNVTD